MSKYLKLDLEAIRRDFPQVWADYQKYFVITPMIGAVNHRPLESMNQIVIPGDSKTFHFLLTKK